MMACHDGTNVETSTKVFEKYCIKRGPAAVYYIPNFVTPGEENRLWHCIYTAPKPKWTVLSHRRLQNWGGLPHSKGMVPEPLPQWLSQYTGRVSALGVFGDSRAANHVLVNEYTPGQGIMSLFQAHVDGPLFYPTISTLNIGGHTLLNLYSLPDDTGGDAKSLTERFLGSLLLEPRSLLILQRDAYTATLHDIADTDTDLVCRDRVLNWDQTALGRWAMRPSQLVANGKRFAGIGTGTVSVVAPSDGYKEKESVVAPDCFFDLNETSHEETNRSGDNDSGTGCSLDNHEASKINISSEVQQENSENSTVENRLAVGSMKKVENEIFRNGDEYDERNPSNSHERGQTDFIHYLHERFKHGSGPSEMRDETSNKVESCSMNNTDSSTIVDGSIEHFAATGSAVELSDAMYSLEVKLAGCENALLNKAHPNSDKSGSSVSLNPPLKASDTLASVHCTLGNETIIDSALTSENNHQQLNAINASQIFGDQILRRTPKGCHCYPTQFAPKEVCQSLAGPGHSSCSAPAVQAVTVAGKRCFLLPRGTRISLTIRHVPKVIKTKIFLGRR